MLGQVRRKLHNTRLLRDIPAVLKFSDSSNTQIHPMDASLQALTVRLLGGFSLQRKVAVWRYLVKRQLSVPLANTLLLKVMQQDESCFDEFVCQWAIPRVLLEELRQMRRSGRSVDEMLDVVNSDRQVTSFLCDKSFDPEAYIELCEDTGIDRRLQSIIIDYRNAFMCHQIRRVVRTIPDESVCAVIVGQNHVSGMTENLSQGLDFVPAEFSPDAPEGKPMFIDQLLLAQLLR